MHGCLAAIVAAVAELPTAVASPGVGVAVTAEGQRESITSAYLDVGEVVLVGNTVGLLHSDGCLAAIVAAVAELSTAVVSPGVGVAVTADGQRMVFACADLGETDAALRGRSDGDLVSAGGWTDGWVDSH